MKLAFIVIDDSELDCFIAKKVIEHTDSSIKVTTYREAYVALSEIQENTISVPDQLTVILLDLKMPIMNGFQFVEEFERLPYSIQDNYAIYVLSSSRNRSDINRVLSHDSIVRMLDKPLTKAGLLSLLTEVKNKHV